LPNRPLRAITIGEGRPLVLLHGFGMRPETYLPVARLLADRAQVLIPAIFELPGAWTFRRALAGLEAIIDEQGWERMSLLGHSFGGGLELGYAASNPSRVVECVFGDTLGVRERFSLAEEALRAPWRVLAMATPRAIDAFARSVLTHPAQLVEAAAWGFLSDRHRDIDAIVAAGIPSHVLWASRDSLLTRADGQQFAQELGATFTVASGAGVDHDWMFDDPEMFAAHMDGLGLWVLSGPDEIA
jgi:pimeloyl-ACP methyl ester carboxylesterase